MINISGHLREERKITGYCNQDVPLIVNCCGKQVFQTQDYFCNRKNGRLDYQIIYIHRGSGHFYLNNEWITLSAGNIVLYRPGIPQYYSYYAKEKPEIYWIHFTGNECENILKQYDVEYEIKPDCAKVTLIGNKVTETPGVIAKIMRALNAENVTLLQSSDSYNSLSCLVDEKDMVTTVHVIHNAFSA